MDDQTDVPVYDSTEGSVMYTDSGDPGYIVDANLPGDSQGETNGYYAGVSENQMGLPSYNYLAANPGTRTDLLSQFRSIIAGAGATANTLANTRASVAQTQARNAYLAQSGYKPTLSEQWAALSPFEQIGFASAVLGLVWFFAKKSG